MDIDAFCGDFHAGEASQTLDHPFLSLLGRAKLGHPLVFPEDLLRPNTMRKKHEEEDHQDGHEIAVRDHPQVCGVVIPLLFEGKTVAGIELVLTHSAGY